MPVPEALSWPILCKELDLRIDLKFASIYHQNIIIQVSDYDAPYIGQVQNHQLARII